MNSSTTYTFTLDCVDISDTNCGWFLQDDTSTTGSYHPNQRGGNSIGLRAGESSLGTWGDLLQQIAQVMGLLRLVDLVM